MNSTNAIEEALKDKCIQEISKVVDVFMNELETKIRGEYNSASYYNFIAPGDNYKASFHVMGTEPLRDVLIKMIKKSHLESMVAVKSKELISKLQLI